MGITIGRLFGLLILLPSPAWGCLGFWGNFVCTEKGKSFDYSIKVTDGRPSRHLKDNFYDIDLNGSSYSLPDEGDLRKRSVRGHCSGQYLVVVTTGYLHDKHDRTVGFVEHKNTYAKTLNNGLRIVRKSLIRIGNGHTSSRSTTYCTLKGG